MSLRLGLATIAGAGQTRYIQQPTTGDVTVIAGATVRGNDERFYWNVSGSNITIDSSTDFTTSDWSDDGLAEKADIDLNNLPSDLTDTEQGIIRAKIGAGTGSGSGSSFDAARVGIEEFPGAEGEFSIVDTQVFTSTALTFVHSDDFTFDATDVAGAIDFRIHSYANLGPITALETGTFTFNIVATSDTSTVVYELGTVPVTSNFGFDEVFEIPASTLTEGTSYSLQTIASTIVNTNLTIHTFWSLAFDGHVQVKPATKDYLDIHYASREQGELADTAIQPGDLGTAAAQDVDAFATGAEGDLATTALQRGEAVPIEDLPTQTAITDVDTLLPTSGAVIDYITTHTTPGTGSIPTQTTITDTDTMIPTSGAVVDYVEATAITKGDALPGGDIVDGSITEAKLNATTNISLDLADSALQDGDALDGGDVTDGTITGDQLDTATNTALAMAITAVQQENLGSPTIDTIPITANRADPSEIDLSVFDSQVFTSIDTTAVIGTPPGTLAYLNGGGNLVDPGVAWADVQGILSGGATLSIFLGDNEGREFMIVEDDDNWAIFTSIANTSGNNESLALIPGESRGLTRQATVTLYKSEAGVLSGMLGTTEFRDSAISQTNGIPVSSATVPTDSDNGTLATTEWVRDGFTTIDDLDNYAIRSEIGTLVIPSTTADFEFIGPYTFADNSQEIVFTGYTTGPDLSVDDTFRVITGFISSFAETPGSFRLSDWTLSLRPATGDDIVIGTALHGADTSHFVGTYLLNSTTVPTAVANTNYSLVLSPEDTNVVLTDVRIHENYVGLTRVLPEIQAIIDASGGGEAEDQFADQNALQTFISDKPAFRNNIVAAERPVPDPTSANSVIQYATDGTPSYTSIPPGSTVDQTFDPTSANSQSGVAVQDAMEIEVGIRTNPSSTTHTRLQHEVTITGDTTVDSGEDYTAPSSIAVDADIDVTIRIDVESFSSSAGVIHVDLTSDVNTNIESIATFNISDLGPIVTIDAVIDGDDLVAGATYDVEYRTVGHGASSFITFISSVDFEFDSGGLFVKPEVDEYVNGLITTATDPLATNENLENNYLTSAEIGEHYLSGRVEHNDGTLILSNGFNPDDTNFFGSHDAFVADGGDRVQVGLAFASGSVREQDLHNGRIFLIQFSNTAGTTSSIIYRARVYFNLVGFPGQPVEIFANLIDSDNNLIGALDAVSSTDTTTVFAALTALAADTSGEPRFNAAQVELSLDLASGEPSFTPSTGLSVDRLNGFEPQGGTFASKFTLFFGIPSAGAQVTVSAVGGDVMRTPDIYTTNGINWYWWSDLTISGSNINVSTTNAGLWTNTDDPDTATIRFNLIG